MLTTVHSVTTHALKPIGIDVQATTTTGIPQIILIGLVDKVAREAKNRVVTALKNSGVKIKARKTIVSLLPPEIKKADSSFDLAIAAALLSLYQSLKINLKNSVVLGEVSLDGSIKPIRGCLAKVLAAKTLGYTTVYIPKDNLSECSVVQGISVLGVTTISQLFSSSNQAFSTPPQFVPQTNCAFAPPEIVGQQQALRALTVALAGHHHIHLVGPPGVGKSLVSQTAQYLQPQLDRSELEQVLARTSQTTQVQNQQPPFRTPHHSITLKKMLGNKSDDIGEMFLAHKGILFLDELPEFKHEVLRGLHSILEQGKNSITNSSNCIVIAASNPCPCGYWKTGVRSCRCSISTRGRYARKLSGPLLERFQIHVQLQHLQSIDYVHQQTLDLQTVKANITAVRDLQKKRYHSSDTFNGDLGLSDIKSYCKLSSGAQRLLDQAILSFQLSTRGYENTVSVAQTIADLEKATSISTDHLSEALNYRFERNWPKDD